MREKKGGVERGVRLGRWMVMMMMRRVGEWKKGGILMGEGLFDFGSNKDMIRRGAGRMNDVVLSTSLQGPVNHHFGGPKLKE